jgi:hypothetical protein
MSVWLSALFAAIIMMVVLRLSLMPFNDYDECQGAVDAISRKWNVLSNVSFAYYRAAAVFVLVMNLFVRECVCVCCPLCFFVLWRATGCRKISRTQVRDSILRV